MAEVLECFWQKGVRARLAVTPGPLHKLLGWDDDQFPVAEDLSLRSLSLPFYPGLSKEEIQVILKVTTDIFKEMFSI